MNSLLTSFIENIVGLTSVGVLLITLLAVYGIHRLKVRLDKTADYKRYKDFVDTMSEGHYEWTPGAGVRWSSGRHHAALGYVDILPEVDDWLCLIHKDDRPAVQAAFDRCVMYGEPYQQIVRARKVSGEWTYHLDMGMPFFDDDGQVCMVMGTHMDVSELVEAQNRLKMAHSERDQFTFIASHDLKEPIRTMMMCADVIIDPETPEDVRKDFAEQLIKSGHKGFSVIESFVKFAKIGVEIDPVPVSLSLVVSDALQTYKNRIETTQTELTIDVPEELHVKGEHALLIQVVENVLGNALKFSSKVEKPSIDISAKLKYPYVVLSVTDNGIGISSEYVDKVGQACFKLNPEREFSGSGLGLTLVKKIVESHHGKIEVSSRGIGHGTEVRVHLPFAESST